MLKADDLAMVVRRSRCGNAEGLGHVFVVDAVLQVEHGECTHCGADHAPASVAIELDADGAGA